MTLPISEDKEEELRFCVDCKHLLGVRSKPWDAENWTCLHPNNVIKNEPYYNLVTGIQEYIREFHEGSLIELRQRDGMGATEYCGPTGKWYEEYQHPKETPAIGGKQAIELEIAAPFSQIELDANRAAATKRLNDIKAKKSQKFFSDGDLKNL